MRVTNEANLGVYLNVSRKVVVAFPLLNVSLSQIDLRYDTLLGGPRILQVERTCLRRRIASFRVSPFTTSLHRSGSKKLVILVPVEISRDMRNQWDDMEGGNVKPNGQRAANLALEIRLVGAHQHKAGIRSQGSRCRYAPRRHACHLCLSLCQIHLARARDCSSPGHGLLCALPHLERSSFSQGRDRDGSPPLSDVQPKEMAMQLTAID